MDKNDPISVLHVASGDLWAGAEVQLFTLAKSLYKQPNCTVNVVIFNHGQLEKMLLNQGINVFVLDESKLNVFQLFLQLNSIIRKLKPTLIHTHRIKENILGSIAAFLNRIPSIRTAHGATENKYTLYQAHKHLIPLIDWLCGRYLQKKIIAVSNDLASILQNTMPSNKITVIENGIDLDATQKHRTQNKKNANSHLFKVGIAGRLVPVKRVDIFIKTAREMLDSHDKIKTEFHIFGDGPLHNELEKLSHNLKTDAIVFFNGHCDNILDKLQELDTLLMPSDHEGLPMILLEAMTLEVPIIAHAVGGIPELLDNGKCGTLISSNNPDDYAKAILQHASNPDEAADLALNAHNRIIKTYSSSHCADLYLSEYSKIVNDN